MIEERPQPTNRILSVEPTYTSKPSELAEIIRSFRSSRENLMLPLQDGFEKKLYATYLSFLPEDGMSYPLVSHSDNRGSFIEFFKTKAYGQLSVNVIKPGAVKGNHYHMVVEKKIPEQVMDFDQFLSQVDMVIIMQNHTHLLMNANKLSSKIVFDTKKCLSGVNIFTY